MNAIEERIKNALLREVYITPKPGLVDLNDCGAHTDMDVHTFECSAEDITPFLLRMYEEGLSFSMVGGPGSSAAEGSSSFSNLFLRVREIGKEAERAMFAATKNVNTHKGIIFSMGLLLTAMGVDAAGSGERADLPYEDRICFLAADIASSVLKEELSELRLADACSNKKPSHGERVFATYGIDGVRGEAISGFPCLREVALPRYRSTRESNLSENDRALDTLLSIMSKLSDTNLLSRGGIDALNFVQSRAAGIINSFEPGSSAWRHEIEIFNAECIEKNISPGGAADILALTLLW